MLKESNWFKDWFNTKYYHILYKNRDFEEASSFLDVLIQFLKPDTGSRFMDLACGKGRHSLYLSKKDFKVIGVDLSVKSIAEAKKNESENLKFLVNDMRHEIGGYQFDYIVNLFTSFGYFDSDEDDQQVIDSCANMLVPGGKFVIDYINVDKAIEDLVPFEIKTIEGIDFQIKKFMEDGFIKKEIHFMDCNTGDKFNFLEKVKVLYREDFESMFEHAGLKPVNIFGDYQLNPFEAEQSDRLIFVTEKTG